MKSFYRVIKYWIEATYRWWLYGHHYETAIIQIDLDLKNQSDCSLSPKENTWVRLLCHLTCGRRFFDKVERTKR